MASKKRKIAVKHKKTTKALVVDSKPEVSKEPSVPLGSPVVMPSGVLEEAAKEQQPQKSEVTESQTQPQPSEQATDALSSQPELAVSSTPSIDTSQNSSSFGGVIRDKPEQEIEHENLDEHKKKRVWIVAIIIIVLVLVGGALWYFRENVMKRAPTQDDTAPAPSLLKNTPTPASDSAKLEIDFSEYKVQVLNGSGIRGEAAKVKELLEAEEFLIEEIGNADKLTYEGTIIKAKKEVPSEFLDRLKIVLEESYILDASEELEDSEEMDVVIIIGSSKQP